MSDIALTIDGTQHAGWTEATVTRALETISGTFTMVLTESAPGLATPRAIRPGQRCSVAVGSETVITGYVDTARVTHGRDNHAIRVTGRDATGDLVDCSAATDPGEWHETTLDRIAAALCQPFGVPVRASADVGQAFQRFGIQEGETVFEAIERGCRMRGILPFPDGRGGLELGRPARTRTGVRLQRGVNILAARGEVDWTDRYSEYKLLGQQQGGDFINPETAAHVAATAVDPGVTRHRPLTVVAEQALDDAEAQTRIDWEASVRAARARRATITVQGWREQPDDAAPVWRPGRLVHVEDDWLGLDREMLIATVQLSIGEQGGTLTRLVVMPEDAFVVRLDPETGQADPQGYWG